MRNKEKIVSKLEPCDWGLVYVVSGKHKGKIGYYDDDEKYCVVYFGDLEDGWVEIKEECLLKINNKELGQWFLDDIFFGKATHLDVNQKRDMQHVLGYTL